MLLELAIDNLKTSMELHDLRYFVAIAEELHFRHAAERLHITQPALSRQIRSLEAELGVMLLQRTQRRVQLTLAGKTLLSEARVILQRAEQAIQTTQRAARGEVGQLKLSFVAPALRGVLPAMIRTFRARYPDVQLLLSEQRTQEQIEAFRIHQIDLGVLYPPVDESWLQVVPIATESWIIALPKQHRLAAQLQLTLSDLAQESFILHPRVEGPVLYDQILRLCEQAGFYPNIVQEAGVSQTRVGLVAIGMGITFVPPHLQTDDDSDVSYRQLQGNTPTLQLATAYRRDHCSPVIQQFLSVVEQIPLSSTIADEV
jgi:DNA-binding transcriptional LysR family regulator